MLPACLRAARCLHYLISRANPPLSFHLLAGLQDTKGVTWSTLGDANNGLPGVMIILGLEWIIFMLLAW